MIEQFIEGLYNNIIEGNMKFTGNSSYTILMKRELLNTGRMQ